MLLGALSLFLLATVPLCGGRLRRLAEVELRGLWLLFGGLALQIWVIMVLAGHDAVPHEWLHLASYGLVGVFVWLNRAVPGMLLLGLGGGLNLLAIAANGGVMPASEDALRTAGFDAPAGAFTNSGAVAGANLSFLGDIFAIPASWPAANVFSIGDVLLLIGFAYGLHRICGSGLLPASRRSLGALADNRPFLRLWTAAGLSQAGDYIHAIAVVTLVVKSGGSAHVLALLLVLQMGPSAITGLLGGPLIDRMSRRALMLGGDVCRALAVGSLVFVGQPSVAHLAVVAVVLGTTGALFSPCLQASLPGLVGDRQLLRANAVLGTTHNLAVMVAPGIGGFIVAQLGGQVAFALNTASFVVSALLVAATRLQRPGTTVPRRASASPLADLREGLAVVRGIAAARALVVFGLLLMIASAVKAPAEPLMVLRELAARPEALGFVTAAWGVGMVAGSAAAGRVLRRTSEQWGLTVAVAVVGATVAVAAVSGSIALIVVLWVVAGAANGLGVVAFETLQQRTGPERFRGRIIATTEAAMDAGYLAGALGAGWLATVAGARWTLFVSGTLFAVAAITAVLRSWRPAYSPSTQARTWSTASST